MSQEKKIKFLCRTLVLIFCLLAGLMDNAWCSEDPRNISLEVRDGDLRETLMQLAAKAKINILLSPKVQGKITCRIADMEPRELIEFIARTNGYVLEDHGNILLILSDQSSGGRMHFEIIPLQNAKAAEVEKIIKNLKMDKRAKVTHDERTNRLIIIWED